MKKESKNSVSITVKSTKKGMGVKLADKLMVVAKKKLSKNK